MIKDLSSVVDSYVTAPSLMRASGTHTQGLWVYRRTQKNPPKKNIFLS